ncbi:maleylpyruvate isomerase family mycothiol-dependent enzyme [Streptomyces clavuligerus]|uniref:Mycothiol-dependent maleylpyruvate isomerase n=1 Tax=Streptomyces clavuligerus TaxID=1901 RepID=B5GXN2_STRCL|nr:maleylpyruvate isomerase family mycothiol-dependent enzyme [Streptomyces clavuligerus]ANW20736.1 mycothiol maleylpyruvate isomerase [Streptomyces clavuligerus]AXU15363.1 maleylpyruvate isomerase family mycothiol-dependent enzyme [Streptomyces clavuligerus]EDY51078.1 mycothiol-dependent maleylpyruvate isomerase [Streptomyces clavuligerus]EFG06238.1 Mycothiol-dependent maleylpyruvate isomerase [Streptomyces clavuligerus]MBY6305452.1 maleylpyruvate isomerase family mycothiol-dependent enzyme [
MIDPVRDLDSVREATERLLTAVDTLDRTRLSGPSRLPGWSRGHVLAHLARNADALVNVLEGRPMYPSAAARETDIERDSGRPLDVQLADVRDSAAQFEAVARLPAEWNRTVALRNGVTDRAARVPFRRLVEVELHHVDLDVGHELEDLPREFVLREIAFLAERFTGSPQVPPVALSAASGESWTTGGTAGARVSVEGPAPELLGWLAGRRAVRASGLTTGGGPLPVLPPL